MKKSTKTILIVALVFVVVGIIISTAIWLVSDGNLGVSYLGRGQWQTNSASGKFISVGLDEEVSNLSINTSGQELQIISSDKFAIDYNENSKLEYEIINSTLIINSKNSRVKNNFVFNWNPNFKTERINIYVPESFDLESISVYSEMGSCDIEGVDADNIDITLDMGSSKIYDVTADSLSVKLDAGSCNFKDVVANDNSSINLSMGSFTANKVTLNNADINMELGSITGTNFVLYNSAIDSSAGSVDISGDLLGESEVSSDLGSIKLNLNGNRSDYFFSTNVELGSINISGKNPSFAENNINVNTSAGSVKVRFK